MDNVTVINEQCNFPPSVPATGSLLHMGDVVKDVSADSTFFHGIESSIAFNNVADQYNICSVCNGFPRTPIRLVKCGHVLCTFCDNRYYHIRSLLKQCPLCRTEFNRLRQSEFLRYADWSAYEKAMHDNSTHNCISPGCTFSGDKCAIMSHLQFECKGRWISCPNLGCTIQGTCSYVEQHYNGCEYFRRECSKCKLLILISEASSHDCLPQLLTVNQSKYFFISCRYLQFVKFFQNV